MSCREDLSRQQCVSLVLQDEDDLGEFAPFNEADRYHGWESLAFFVRYQGPNPKVGVKDLWTSELESATDEEWRKAFRALCEHHWPARSARIRWAEDTRRKLADRRDDALGKADALAANRALE